MTLQAATIDRQRWSARDMTRQIVPNMGSNDQKRSVADSRQPCTANEQIRGRTPQRSLWLPCTSPPLIRVDNAAQQILDVQTKFAPKTFTHWLLN